MYGSGRKDKQWEDRLLPYYRGLKRPTGNLGHALASLITHPVFAVGKINRSPSLHIELYRERNCHYFQTIMEAPEDSLVHLASATPKLKFSKDKRHRADVWGLGKGGGFSPIKQGFPPWLSTRLKITGLTTS